MCWTFSTFSVLLYSEIQILPVKRLQLREAKKQKATRPNGRWTTKEGLKKGLAVYTTASNGISGQNLSNHINAKKQNKAYWINNDELRKDGSALGTFEEDSKKSWRKEGTQSITSVSKREATFLNHIFVTLFSSNSTPFSRRGQPCLWSSLLHHFDPEGHATQELIPLIVVAEVGAVDPALHGQLLVVVFLGNQQLYSHQRLQVILLQHGSVSQLQTHRLT